MMMTYDFSPLLRNAIGFDRLMHLVDNVAQQNPALSSGYPPYNIEKIDDAEYRLTMAVAGFGPDDISVEVEGNHLTISGKMAASSENVQVLHRGIASRAFERSFTLADHVEIESVELNNGLLSIGLKQIIPEALKPRKVPVTSGVSQQENVQKTPFLASSDTEKQRPSSEQGLERNTEVEKQLH